MSWKYLIGLLIQRIESIIICSKLTFVYKNFPYGRNWIFDLKRILATNPEYIVDAGANIGEVSKQLAYHFPNSTIHAFEPIHDTYLDLRKNIDKITSINIHQLALGKNEEQIEIYLNTENTINSLKSKHLNENNSVGKELITIQRLDSICKSLAIKHIGILKIDVEGFEFEVLEGCGEMLRDDIDCILLEVGYEREDTKVHFSDVETYLEKYDFQLAGIYEIMRNLNDKRKIAYSNNLYIKKKLFTN